MFLYAEAQWEEGYVQFLVGEEFAHQTLLQFSVSGYALSTMLFRVAALLKRRINLDMIAIQLGASAELVSPLLCSKPSRSCTKYSGLCFTSP